MRTQRRPSDITGYEAGPFRQRMESHSGGMPMGFDHPMDDQQPRESLWKMVDDRLHGRWRLAILVGLGLSFVLGMIGYMSAAPMYESRGIVEIKSEAPIVLTPTFEGTNQWSQHSKQVATQMQFIKSPRCLKAALDDEQLRQFPWATQKGALGFLKDGLKIEADQTSELVFVSFESEDPITAEVAVNAVMRAYDRLYAKDGGTINASLRMAGDALGKYERELKTVREQRNQIISKYDRTDLGALEKENNDKIAHIEAVIETGRFMMARLTKNATSVVSGPREGVSENRILDKLNPNLTVLRNERDRASNEFEKAKLNYLPGAPTYIVKKNNADNAEEVYQEERRKTLEDFRQYGTEALADNEGIPSPERIVALEKALAALKQKQQGLVGDLAVINDLKDHEAQVQSTIGGAQARIRELETELPFLKALVSVNQFGSLPEEPSNDARRKRGIMGVGLGMMASFGAFFILGGIDRRAYAASQLAHVPGSRVPACLGVLPDLGASLSDPESSDVASHCVHQIRNQIEAVRDPQSGYVLAITSPFQGDGKTSIVLALGWSYAAAGYNTLLIDCDMVGRSLTRQLGLSGREGLKEALMARELNGSISRMPVEHLSAIPVGVDARMGPENVRRRDLETLVDQMRDQYDIIIVDTGPMLGSLESTPVTAMADGVVLSVRRGRSRARLEECVNRLDLVGTKCVGVILNCAVRSDCNRYVSEASLAAAEEDRSARADGGDSSSIIQVPAGERNALVRAMQTTSRAGDGS